MCVNEVFKSNVRKMFVERDNSKNSTHHKRYYTAKDTAKDTIHRFSAMVECIMDR